MFTVGLLQWWYGAGIKTQVTRVSNRIAGMYDYFSIDLLLRSLFSPFRQISATKVSGSLNIQFRAFIDRLVSRSVGAVMRTVLIIVGVVGIVFLTLLSIVWLVIWALLPIVPVVGFVLALAGWAPWKM